MKHFLLLAILGVGLCVVPTINAQESVAPTTNTEESKSPWTFGVKAGLNASSFDTGEARGGWTYMGPTNFNVGATVEYALKKNFFLKTGLDFTTKRTTVSWFGDAVFFTIPGQEGLYGLPQMSFKDEVKLSYLQIPLTIGKRLPISKNTNITFEAGGYFALAVSGKSQFQSWLSEMQEDGTWNTTNRQETINKAGDTDYGLLGGVGFEYKKISINGTYEYGLRKIYTGASSYGPADFGGGLKNRNLTLSVGYKF